MSELETILLEDVRTLQDRWRREFAGRPEAERVRALLRQTLMWIWKDEQLHSEFMRGLLLESGGLGSSLVVYGRQIQGALSGWTSSTATNRETRLAPFRTGAADALVTVARA